jgi:2'-5' RNA ligase
MRCFVAARPGKDALRDLELLSERLHRRYPGARRLRGENLHLTLAFIGELDDPRAQAAAHAVRSILIESFDWHPDRVGHFARARVIWVGGDDPVLSSLALRVRATLQALKIAFDPKPFVAHVSLLRDVPVQRRLPGDAPWPIDTIAWRIDGAELLVSETDSRGLVHYRTL